MIAIWILGLLPTAAFGASILVTPFEGAERSLVVVSGPFREKDIEDFQSKTASISSAIVVLASDGGSLTAGMAIGEAVRLKDFTTLVLDGSRCASACALVWLGGTKRFMGSTAKVGFHAAAVVPGNFTINRPSKLRYASVANALLGAYLNKIGLPDKAVVYVTLAQPNEMTWLTWSDAERVGIDVALFIPNSATAPGVADGPPWSPTNSIVMSPRRN